MTKQTKSVSLSYIADASEASALIRSIKTRGAKLDKDLHLAAVTALFHGFQHKSTGIAENLLDSLPASSRKKALQVYLLDLGCFMLKEDGKTMGIDQAKHTEGFKFLAAATATPFWKYTAEVTPASNMIAMDELAKLIKRLTIAQGAGKLDADSMSVLNTLKTIAPAVIAQDAPEQERVVSKAGIKVLAKEEI